MSVNLHLGIVIRGYSRDRTEAIGRAVRDVLEREEIHENLPPLTESQDGNGYMLSSRSDPEWPVIISRAYECRAYEWTKRVERELREAAAAANGGPCVLQFECDDADEDREEDEDDDD
jgi:hypothetical protein